MLIKQLSVFVENTSGRLADITAILAQAGIDIRALSIADTTNFGILRLIVNRPDLAEQALKEAGFTVSLTDVIAIGMADEPGAFAKAMQALADACISIEYMYAFNSRDQGRACVILRVKEVANALEALKARNIEILDEAKVYTM